MKRNGFRDDYYTGNSNRDRYGEPIEEPRRKSSFTKILFVGLLLFIVGSYTYEHFLKNISFENNNKQVLSEDQNEIIETDDLIPDLDIDLEESAEIIAPKNPKKEKSYSARSSSSKDSDRGLSTHELLERRNHANAAERAKRMGVSTEGSTLDILERINHANAVERAKRMGVSTEGSTLDILERINHANAAERAKRMGVSTEGSTLDILERMNHKRAVENARRMGVSTEGSTLDILERINNKRLKDLGY